MKNYVVRHYDGFDNEWIDVSGRVSKEEAQKIYDEKTNNGKSHTSYGDIDYYRIFEANTVMHFSEEGRKKINDSF